MTKPIIIAFTGVAGAGKSLAAQYLAEQHGFFRTRFAAPLKAMTRSFLWAAGVSRTDVERMIEGDLKEVPSRALCGKTPRVFMQLIGTEFGREMIGDNLWTEAWKTNVMALIEQGESRIVIEDCRFPNEAEAIRELGGAIIRIKADHLGVSEVAKGHASEAQEVMPDTTLWNTGTRGIFTIRLDGLIDRYTSLAVRPLPIG